MATLAGVDRVDFNDLKVQLGLTDGNLSTHLTALANAGYVKIAKSFKGRKPRTTVSQTARGRRSLTNYIDLLQGILAKAK